MIPIDDEETGAEEECPLLNAVLAGRARYHSDASCGWCHDIRRRAEQGDGGTPNER